MEKSYFKVITSNSSCSRSFFYLINLTYNCAIQVQTVLSRIIKKATAMIDSIIRIYLLVCFQED